MSDDFLPSCSVDVLVRRAQVVRKIRQFFDDRGFCEVDTPLLSADTVVDRYIDPVCVTLFSDPRQPGVGREMWLQTSPEFAMKRLLVGGMTAIYQIAHAVRGGEQGEKHNPEFTLLEWYRVGDNYEQGRNLLAEFAKDLFTVPSVEQISYATAFERALGIQPHLASEQELQVAAERAGVASSASDDRDGWLNLLLAECVEPTLGKSSPTILFDFPASQAALAKTRAMPERRGAEPSTQQAASGADYAVAERFELYYRGIEIANGYHELLDADVLLARNQANNLVRTAEGRYELPNHSRLLDAMRHGLPACCGVAVGLERLLMALWSEASLKNILPFPIDRA